MFYFLCVFRYETECVSVWNVSLCVCSCCARFIFGSSIQWNRFVLKTMFLYQSLVVKIIPNDTIISFFFFIAGRSFCLLFCCWQKRAKNVCGRWSICGLCTVMKLRKRGKKKLKDIGKGRKRGLCLLSVIKQNGKRFEVPNWYRQNGKFSRNQLTMEKGIYIHTYI